MLYSKECQHVAASLPDIDRSSMNTHLTVSHHIQQRNNVWSSTQILKDLNFSLYLLLLDRLEDFDDAFLVVDDVDSLEYFRVFSTACSSWYQFMVPVKTAVGGSKGARTYFPNNFIVLQHAPRDVDAIIVPVCPWHLLVDVCVYTGHAVRSGPILACATKGR